MTTYEQVLGGLMGVCVGDALGLPVQFKPRSEREKVPVTTMIGYGCFRVPPGVWSDDSSLTFCLAEAMIAEGLTSQLYNTLAKNFCRWLTQGYWTPYNESFDVGGTTSAAINRLLYGVEPLEAGLTQESSNGNGSLMRILPLAFVYNQIKFEELLEIVHNVSSITHAHLRSQIACGIYITIAIALLEGNDLLTSYHQGIARVAPFYQKSPYQKEVHHFQRVFSGNIADVPMEEISSSGYVVHTLEAALWCLLTTSSYEEATLKAVNLGEDTDTTAAVAGGLAGIYYGVESIPAEWMLQIVHKEKIVELAQRFFDCLLR